MSDYTSLVTPREPGNATGSAHQDTTSFKAQHMSLFKLGIERSGEAIFLTDIGGKILYVNPAFEKIYGFTSKEVLGQTPRILKSGQLAADVYGDIWNRLLNKEIVSGEIVNKTKDGRLLTIESSANPVLDDSGKIIGFLAIQRDITDRKQTEEALRNSEERFRGIFENATIGIYRTTPDGLVLMANPALIRMLGYGSFEELAKQDLECGGYNPQYPRAVFKKMMDMMGVVHGLESAWKKADGGYVQVLESARTIRDKNGEILYYEGTVEDITNRKKAEDALRENEERFRMIFETGPFPMVLSNTSLKFVKANTAFCKMLGYSEDEIVRLTFKDITHPDYIARDSEAVQKVCSGELPVYNAEKRYLRKDGSIVWGSVTLGRICDKDGQLSYILAMVEEINERKKIEEALRDSEERYRLLIENANDAIFITQNFKIIYSNNKISEISGYGMQNIIGKPFEPFIHTDDRAMVLEHHRARMAGEKVEGTYRFRVLHQDGSIRWLEINAVKVEWYGKPATLNFGRDITARVRADEALRAESERAQSYLNTAGVIFVAIDSEAKITLLNRKGYEVLGYNEGELIGKDWFRTCIPPEESDQVRDVFHKIIDGEIEFVEYHENRVYTKTGEKRIIAWRNTALKDANGKIISTLSSGEDITGRRQADSQLQVEKAYFEQLFECAPEAVVVGNIDGKITRTNPEFTRMFGYLQEETIGKYIDDILAPGEHRAEAAQLTDKVADGDAISCEGIRYRKDGQPVYVSIVGTPINTSDGQIAVYAIYRDISEQKRAESLNLARTRFLSKLVGLTDASDLAILAFEHVRHLMPVEAGALVVSHNDDSEFELVFSADTEEDGQLSVMTNRGFIKMDSSSTTEQVFKQGLKQIKHRTEEEAHSVIPFNEGMPAYNLRASRSLAYFPLIVHGRTLGVFSFLSYSADVFTEARVALLESITADIGLALTAVKMTEALKESEEQYRSLIETMPNGLLIVDKNLVINFVNPAACQILGYSKEKAIGLNITSIIPENEIPKLLEQSRKRQRGEPGEYEATIIRGDGEHRIMFVVAAPRLGNTGEITGAIALFSDITETKNLEEERLELREKLSRAQRMESLGVLAGGVAHDLNNILGPLVAYPELIRMKLPLDSPVVKQVSKIESSAQRAAEVVQDLLTMARRGRYEMKPTSINMVVESYLQSPDFFELKPRFPNVLLDLKLDPQNRLVYGSTTHLYKVIMNLVLNAMDAMPHGGELSIKTEFRQIDKLIGGYDNIDAGEYAILTVSDTGVGIATKDYKRLFEPFYTKKEMGRSGSGLGLAIVYGVIKDHNGYIDVRSEPEKGSEFIIYIPTTHDTVTGEEHEPISITGNERILIVDDVPEQRELAVTILGTLGYKAECVPEGHAAVKYLERNSVDVVVLDMIMEPDFDGLDTYRAILETHPGQKAIITSGYSETERVKEAERLGVGKYIRKPYTMQKLGKAIREVLDAPETVHA